MPRARQLLAQAQVVVGYKTYLELIRGLLSHQETVATGMRGEVSRCLTAIDRARGGERVAIVSSGDAGIYGMAGLVLEICQARGLTLGGLDDDGEADLRVEVVPGVSALSAGAALLGAPLMHDFVVLSLSDLLTPWELIARRVELAAAGDFVVVIYNPRSAKRDWQLRAVQDLMLKHRQPETPVGIVRRARREGEEVAVTTLAEMAAQPVDMQTIVFIGNSRTAAVGNRLVTPRGYGDKYDLEGGGQGGTPPPAPPDGEDGPGDEA